MLASLVKREAGWQTTLHDQAVSQNPARSATKPKANRPEAFKKNSSEFMGLEKVTNRRSVHTQEGSRALPRHLEKKEAVRSCFLHISANLPMQCLWYAPLDKDARAVLQRSLGKAVLCPGVRARRHQLLRSLRTASPSPSQHGPIGTRPWRLRHGPPALRSAVADPSCRPRGCFFLSPPPPPPVVHGWSCHGSPPSVWGC